MGPFQNCPKVDRSISGFLIATKRRGDSRGTLEAIFCLRRHSIFPIRHGIYWLNYPK